MNEGGFTLNGLISWSCNLDIWRVFEVHRCENESKRRPISADYSVPAFWLQFPFPSFIGSRNSQIEITWYKGSAYKVKPDGRCGLKPGRRTSRSPCFWAMGGLTLSPFSPIHWCTPDIIYWKELLPRYSYRWYSSSNVPLKYFHIFLSVCITETPF